MVLLNNSTFLKELAKLCSVEGEGKKSNSVWITMKRGKREPVQKKTEEKPEVKEKKSKRTTKDLKSNNKISFIIKATDGKKKKISTRVTENAYQFMQEVNKSISSSMGTKK